MAIRWFRKLVITLATAALVVVVLLGGAWLSTHQSSLEGLMPVMALIGLGATVYGVKRGNKR